MRYRSALGLTGCWSLISEPTIYKIPTTVNHNTINGTREKSPIRNGIYRIHQFRSTFTRMATINWNNSTYVFHSVSFVIQI